jgi:hypothetical protein
MTITTNPTNILPAGAAGYTWIVQNLGTEAIYIARTAAGATSTEGVKVGQYEAIEVKLSTSGTTTLYAATATGTADVRVIKTN